MWKKYDKIDNKYIIGIDPCNNTKNIKPITIMRAGEDELRMVDVFGDADFDVNELCELLREEYNAVLIDEQVLPDKKQTIKMKYGKMFGEC